jgi:hypothetical protein
MLDVFREVETFLKNKLYSILRLFKFFFLPRNRFLIALLIINVVFFVFLFGKYSQAFDLPSFDDVVTIINRLLFLVAYALGWLVMKLFAVVVYISGYNGFVDSAAVSKGWVLVRDVCNMLFVVVLLVIAFGEILRLKSYQLKAMLPKVILAAVLVNFSKLICALIIDAAQVAMMTFVNGYQATAGANIVVGLGLTKLLKFNEQSGTTAGTDMTPWDITVGIVLAIIMMIATLLVVFFIALILVVRIVILWFLIVLSPVAFLSGAVPIKAIQSKSSEWWNRFGSYVAIGPVMAFFLWLSLSIMANPDQMYAKDEKLAAIEATGKSSSTEMGMVDNIIQFGIGLALLMASLVAAQEVGGFAGSLAKTGIDTAKSAAKKTGKWMASPVTDRASALYGGFAEGQKRKTAAKQADLARTWGNAGRKAFRAKEGAVMGAKQIAGEPFKLGAGMLGAGAGLAGGAARGLLPGGKGIVAGALGGAAAGGFAGRKLVERVAGNGDFERQSRQASFVETQKANTAAATAILKGRNLDNGKPESQASLRAMALNPTSSSAERKAALDILSKQGKIDSRELVVAGQSLFQENEKAGDFKSGQDFMTAVKKTRADLAYDYSKKGGLTPEEEKSFAKEYKKGDISFANMDAEALENPALLAAARKADSKRFGKDMSAMGHGDDPNKSAAVNKGLSALGNGILAAAAKSGRSMDDDPKDIRKTMVAAGVPISQAFGQRDAAGELTGAGLDAALTDLGAAIKGMSGSEYRDAVTDPGVSATDKSALIENVETRHLDALASSADPGDHAAMEKIISAIETLRSDAVSVGNTAEADKHAKKLVSISSNSRVMDKLSGTTRSDVVTVRKDDIDNLITRPTTGIDAKLAAAVAALSSATITAGDKKKQESIIQSLTDRKLKLEEERDKIS